MFIICLPFCIWFELGMIITLGSCTTCEVVHVYIIFGNEIIGLIQFKVLSTMSVVSPKQPLVYHVFNAFLPRALCKLLHTSLQYLALNYNILMGIFVNFTMYLYHSKLFYNCIVFQLIFHIPVPCSFSLSFCLSITFADVFIYFYLCI